VRWSGISSATLLVRIWGFPKAILGSVRQQLRPLFDQVVIKELDPDRVRRSGLVLPPGEHESPPQQGIVLAVGPGLDWWGSVGVKMPVVAGDHVVFPASAGVWVEVEEERLLVCRVGQLLGVLEEASDGHSEDALRAFEDDEA
jgi:chaperonin GroES